MSKSDTKFTIGGDYKDAIECIEGDEDKSNDIDELSDKKVDGDSTEHSLDLYTFNEPAKSLIKSQKATFFSQPKRRTTGVSFTKPNRREVKCHVIEETDGPILCMPIIGSNPDDVKNQTTFVETDESPSSPTLIDISEFDKRLHGTEMFFPQLVCAKCCDDGRQILNVTPIRELFKKYVEDDTSWFGWEFILTHLIIL